MIKRIVITITVVTIIILILIPLTYELAYAEKIYPGVKIGQIDVGNKTPQTAKELFQTLINQNNQTLKIIHPISKQIWEIKPQEIDLTFNLENSMQSAYLVGRQGTLTKRLTDKKRAWEEKINILPTYSFNQEKLNGQIAIIAAAVSIPTVSPKISLENGQIIIDPGQPGQELDQRRLQILITNHIALFDQQIISLPIKTINPPPETKDIERIKNQANSLIGKSIQFKDGQNEIAVLKDKNLINLLRFSPVDFEEEIKKQIVDLAAKQDRESKDALFEFKNNRVVVFQQAQSGKKLNQEKTRLLLQEAIEELITEEGKTIEIILPLDIQSPRISTEEVNNLGIKELIGKGISYFRGSATTRLHNIQLASSRLNGLLIKPEEIFSFNQALGEISTITGYQKAYIIKEGRTILGDGGGVCQVSTTFFRAALNAGLPIIERTAHAYRVYYYEQESAAGIDATVFTPSPDLKIKNDTAAHILIQSKFLPQEYKLIFELYGTSDGRKTITANNRLWDIIPPPEPLYIDDPALPKDQTKQIDWAAWGGKAAFDWKVTRGNEILQERTFYSIYQPWQAVYLRGTKE
ncbi:hypothetical protein COT63_01615 [Candidatus Shapirobacteria bacterium CG09_land_8_20_14_0_10_38_17]|uniref:YoaR-like putative peptidoglycan binding domain-containing protein n=1 Tax=Candidatus Shapirobacteria bacterium CG09_land_8_20_14_0_10_38_17 TaxID=1974884 RepID=A0A2H0WR26_9BACT|nr:MAG: hypothetical protein COT63_01615 [Candidatus Shapirobacteria bacterium CG09_land_8_20_14_0_10_38_17]